MSVVNGIRVLARAPTRKMVTAEELVAAGYHSGGPEAGESLARKLSAV